MLRRFRRTFCRSLTGATVSSYSLAGSLTKSAERTLRRTDLIGRSLRLSSLEDDMPPSLLSMQAREITEATFGLHVQFRVQTDDGLRVHHGKLVSAAPSSDAVLVVLGYVNGEEREFTLDPNTGVTFIVIVND